MTSRPVVSVYSHETGNTAVTQATTPAVFAAPIRDDTVQFVHSNMAKNRRQAHGVFFKAGHEHSAESWGTGRAVARIPRISGSGTHRSGQAAFGNMCRKGRMFAPLKIWRKWHRKINTNQKRHAVASALAASACAPLVQARGHNIESVPELPLVVDTLNVDSTKALFLSLNRLGAKDDLIRAAKSKRTRAGQGKMRSSRFTIGKGPLLIYGDENPLVKRTARNLTGVDTCSVHRLNLLQLAPGGHLGRFCIFTKDAFNALNNVFGTFSKAGVEKSNYNLQRDVMACADLARIINSDQVQNKLREIRTTGRVHDKTKKNPLTNRVMMQRLNPYSKTQRAAEAKAIEARRAARATALKHKRSKAGRAEKAKRTTRFNGLATDLESSFAAAHQQVLDEIKAGQFDQEDSEEDDE